MTVFTVMLSLGLLLEREQIATALRRIDVLVAVLFAVVVPVPVLAVITVKLFGLRGAVAAGIVLMSISPGAPVALRRAIQAGAGVGFAPALHLAIGWAPSLAGVGLTLCALFAGTIVAGRDASVRPAAAVAAAMRNPGLALLIATRNAAPPDVTASVFGYALGLAGVIFAFLAWRKWRHRGAVPEAASK